MRRKLLNVSHLLRLVVCVVIAKEVAVQIVVVEGARRRAGLVLVGDGSIVGELVLRKRVRVVAHGRVAPSKAPGGAMVPGRWAVSRQ